MRNELLALDADKKSEEVDSDASHKDKKKWWQTLSVYLCPEVLRMLFLGFSAGLPFLLTVGTLSLRLSQANIQLATIGFTSWVGLIYAFKWGWSPFVDRLSIPFLTARLGRRRSWMLLAQLLIMIGLVGMAFADVQQGVSVILCFALLVAFASATQDIALDAYRIESAEVKMQGALAAMYSAGYRLAMIWSGAGALWVVGYMRKMPHGQYDAYAWQVSYVVMAASILVGVLAVLLAPEPEHSLVLTQKYEEIRLENQGKPLLFRLEQWVSQSVVAPFADFLSRYKKQALVILALIALYRISDVVMGTMSNPFYHYMGYTEMEIANVSKVFGVIMTLVGTFVGGFLVMRIGVFKILLLGAVLSAATNVLFALLAVYGHGHDFSAYSTAVHVFNHSFYIRGDVIPLVCVISLDNLSGGIASAAFIAYLSSLTRVQFSATQYALFSSLMQLIPKFIGGFSGVFVEASSYPVFFVCTALLGVPVLYLVYLVKKLHEAGEVVKR